MRGSTPQILSLLEEHEINLVPFSASALALLPDEGAKWQVPEHDALQRRDLRKTHRIFSVDPPGCQDIDDTMHAKGAPFFLLTVNVEFSSF